MIDQTGLSGLAEANLVASRERTRSMEMARGKAWIWYGSGIRDKGERLKCGAGKTSTRYSTLLTGKMLPYFLTLGWTTKNPQTLTGCGFIALYWTS